MHPANAADRASPSFSVDVLYKAWIRIYGTPSAFYVDQGSELQGS